MVDVSSGVSRGGCRARCICGLDSMARGCGTSRVVLFATGAGRALLSVDAASIAASFCGGVTDSVAPGSCVLRRLKPLAEYC